MNDVVGQLLPLAFFIAVSPIPIAAEIALLFSDRPLASAGAYIGGFIVSVVATLAVLLAVASTQDLAPGSGGSTAAAWVRLGLGALLVVAAVQKYRSRPGPDDEPPTPRWMAGISSSGPGKAAGIGLLVGVNPKNLAMALAAAAAIAGGGLSSGQQVLAVAIYSMIAVLGVLVPFGVAVVMGSRAHALLGEWREWLTRNNAHVMAILFLVFGVILIGQGLQAL